LAEWLTRMTRISNITISYSFGSAGSSPAGSLVSFCHFLLIVLQPMLGTWFGSGWSSGVRGRFERSDSSESSVKPECYHGTATTMTSTRVLEQNNNGDVFPSNMRTKPLALVVPPARRSTCLPANSAHRQLRAMGVVLFGFLHRAAGEAVQW
jgi:hypothetical protein